MARTFAVGDHLYYPGPASGSWTTGTIAFRFKHTSTAVMLMAQIGPASTLNDGFDILANPFSVGRIFAEGYAGTGGAKVQVASPASPAYNDGALHSMVFVWDRANGSTSTLYIDGASVGTGVATAAWNLGGGSGNPRIGLGDDTSGFYTDYAGTLSDFAVWGDAKLNADEIAALAKGFPAHLIRPTSLSVHIPLVRDTHDLRGGVATTTVGTSVSDHPKNVGGAV